MNYQREFSIPLDDALELLEGEGGLGLWSWDLASGRLKWSAGTFAIFGIEAGSVEPSVQYMRDFVLAEDRRHFTDEAMASGSDALSELRFRIVRPDGQLRWLRCCSRMVNGDEGTPAHMYGVIFDITEKRQALDTHRRHSGLIEAVGSLFDLLVWVAKPDGSLAESIVAPGSAGEPALEWDGLAQVHPDDRYGVELAWAEAIADGRRYAASFRVREPDGEYFPITSRAASIRDPEGNLQGWIGFSTRHAPPQPTGSEEISSSAAPPLTPAQVRAARGYLGWSAHDLALKAEVSFSTVRRVETPGSRNVREQSLTAIRRAFEQAGIRFITNSDGSTGIIVS